VIIYVVRFQDFASPGHTQTHRPQEPYFEWHTAKRVRNELFFTMGEVRRCWVEKIDRVATESGVVLSQSNIMQAFTSDRSKERWGEILKRDKVEHRD
jgi:hypothetical protein